jgi:phosphoglycolate phosphatase
MSALRAILLDKDGTLFDFAATWTVWAQQFPRRITEDEVEARQLGAAIGFDPDEGRFAHDSIAIAGTAAEIAQALAGRQSTFRQDELLRIINEEAAGAPQREAVPLGPFLTGLRGRGLRLGVVTNDSEQAARAHLHKANVLGYLDFMAGYDSGFGAKPSPAPLLAFAQHVGVPSEQIAMVGDSLHDLKAARAAGMVSVGVLTGLASPRDLAPYADMVLPDIGHLPGWLDQAGPDSS